MPEFISKLQYKTYEKGEYSDEKSRNLAETIELINNFPWVTEQYADIELTGPSITIQDGDNNFLKVGIYYGGKFSLYYLDAKYNYYRKLNVNMDIVDTKINEFFKGQIDLQILEKHKLAFGIKDYFITDQFEYNLKFRKVLLLSVFWIIYFFMCLGLTIVLDVLKPFKPPGIFPVIFLLLFSWPLALIFNFYRQKRNQYLRISRGNDIFLFGDNQDEIKTCNKNDIIKINHYVDKGTRSPNMFEIIEIVFKDNTSIEFSNGLISFYELSAKFSDKWQFSKNDIRQNLFKIIGTLS